MADYELLENLAASFRWLNKVLPSLRHLQQFLVEKKVDEGAGKGHVSMRSTALFEAPPLTEGLFC